ncbi:hypothetical protein F5Y18DRAFT_377470 [Xylariaceae sp. FL1019]|nr:hypothetical protein F5Y18DRAFT_377470 [Xylariaceae sp. FL1019]
MHQTFQPEHEYQSGTTIADIHISCSLLRGGPKANFLSISTTYPSNTRFRIVSVIVTTLRILNMATIDLSTIEGLLEMLHKDELALQNFNYLAGLSFVHFVVDFLINLPPKLADQEPYVFTGVEAIEDLLQRTEQKFQNALKGIVDGANVRMHAINYAHRKYLWGFNHICEKKRALATHCRQTRGGKRLAWPCEAVIRESLKFFENIWKGRMVDLAFGRGNRKWFEQPMIAEFTSGTIWKDLGDPSIEIEPKYDNQTMVDEALKIEAKKEEQERMFDEAVE